jgi:lysylphosphatidylglycerol synthetase-like protein (DUF2156 family)
MKKKIENQLDSIISLKKTIRIALSLVGAALFFALLGLADGFVRAYKGLIVLAVLVCLNLVVLYKNFRRGGLRGIVWDLVGLAFLVLAWTAYAYFR